MRCVYCRSEIQEGAEKCPECSQFQRRYRNWLPPVVGVFVALLTLMLSNTGFFNDMYDYLTGEDNLEVKALESSDQLVVLNTGDGQLLVEALLVSREVRGRRWETRIPIYQTVKSGEFLTTRLPERPQGPLADNLSDEIWNRLLAGDLSSHVPAYYLQSSPSLRSIREMMGNRLKTFSAKGQLTYRSSRNHQSLHTEHIDLTGVFLERQPPS